MSLALVLSYRESYVPTRLSIDTLSSQVKEEARAEHEVQRLREHLALLLNGLLETRLLSGDSVRELGDCDAHTSGPASESPKTTELLRRCEELERKTATFENIVCVLNREVERVAMTSEACGRQHRLDQDRIEALSNKVCVQAGLALIPLALGQMPLGSFPGRLGLSELCSSGPRLSGLLAKLSPAYCSYLSFPVWSGIPCMWTDGLGAQWATGRQLLLSESG